MQSDASMARASRSHRTKPVRRSIPLGCAPAAPNASRGSVSFPIVIQSTPMVHARRATCVIRGNANNNPAPRFIPKGFARTIGIANRATAPATPPVRTRASVRKKPATTIRARPRVVSVSVTRPARVPAPRRMLPVTAMRTRPPVANASATRPVARFVSRTKKSATATPIHRPAASVRVTPPATTPVS